MSDSESDSDINIAFNNYETLIPVRTIFHNIGVQNREPIQAQISSTTPLFALDLFTLLDSQTIERHFIEIAIEESMDDSDPISERKIDQIIDADCFNYNSKYHDVGEDKECSICKVCYKQGDDLSILNCEHIFHTKCIEEWGLYKAECPLCRCNIPLIEKN